MEPSNVVSVLLELLVDPVLAANASSQDSPALSQQQSIAKQVHSVVLLYNYYYRKQHPELDFLPFDEFCKLAVSLRPSLLAHMKWTRKSDETELVDAVNQLSLTEEKIMEACNISRSLDPSKSVPNVEGWPISKVAVLLVDCKMENCFLLSSSITKGVWSLIEKDVDASSLSSIVSSESGTRCYKKRKVIDELQNTKFMQIGYSAVKEAAGVNETDITVLGSYTVYSESKEKEASCFFIMKCSQLINQEANRVHIRDLIQRLQGPLVKMSSSSWSITPVVEFFHLLPYSEVISEWFSRETDSNSLQEPTLGEKNANAEGAEGTESHISKGMNVGLASKPSSDNIESLQQKENNKRCTIAECGSVKEAQDMDLNNSSVVPSQNKECQLNVNTLHVSEDQNMENKSTQHDSNGFTHPIKVVKVDPTMSPITEGGTNNQPACNKIWGSKDSEKGIHEESAPVANNSHSNIEKLQNLLLDSKGETLSETSLAVLNREKNELTLQRRMIEEDIALCDEKIKRILADVEDSLETTIDAIIEGCNYSWEGNHGGIRKNLEDPCLAPSNKMKSGGDSVLIAQSPCQELDSICNENIWTIPMYRVSPSDGGFRALVTFKGPDFECSLGGDTCSNPREARGSVAARVLANLRSKQKSASDFDSKA
ncbi:uncharacterized protein LOC130945052 [Arachis stenosperma]|uniref:uncharacterized protein LOC130945052 n=1 Tax=Arachis stenosperma TaxID=217475 RepID=UPI0025ACD1FD|nr:uncharacterized protein LOC130945052 [Arachis stenosperma]XP_057729692.1 uncharacterized protein LOC130945052 [Arachis stenosperma]XP_057729693.1 uncharacterized protein LOC130945052 [Arachis stenosperma]